jgi:hypothetical protein
VKSDFDIGKEDEDGVVGKRVANVGEKYNYTYGLCGGGGGSDRMNRNTNKMNINKVK